MLSQVASQYFFRCLLLCGYYFRAEVISLEMIYIHVHMPCILAAVTIWGWHLFRSELPIVQLLFEGGGESIRWNMVHKIDQYPQFILVVSQRVRWECDRVGAVHARGNQAICTGKLPCIWQEDKQLCKIHGTHTYSICVRKFVSVLTAVSTNGN